MNWMTRFRIMPLLIVVAALSFGVRFSEFVTGVSTTPKSAQAQSIQDAQDDSLGSAPALPATPVMDEDGPRTAPVAPNMDDAESVNWKDAGDTDFEFSETRMELFKDLSKRRKELEARERELSVREALLKTAEQEIQQKYKELVSVRAEIQELLVEQSAEEKQRTASLVKIYEGMKPKDAARIFNTLDRDVLLSVISRMSERKSAPILASMDPARARTVTIMLMEQKSLPALDDSDLLTQ